jgi:outer membrane protein assembly factor BamB
MNPNDAFSSMVADWLRADAEHRVPDHLDAVLRRTSTERQRPAWSSLERWLPVDTTFRPRLLNVPSAGRLVAVAALLLLILAISIFAVGSQQRLPEPFGLARNGIWLSSRDGDIYAIDPATMTSTALISGSAEYDFGPTFSRDGTKFGFLRSDGPVGAPATLTLMVANADGSDLRAVTPPTLNLDWTDWSPDSRQIAYMASGQLYVVALDGSGPRKLEGTGEVHFVSWLPPDGTEIVFTRTGPSPAIFAIRPDGTGLRQISTTPARNEFDYQSLAVAADGRHIGFTRWDNAGWPSVNAVDVQDGSETVFPETGTGERELIYSPDATVVAFTRIYPDGGHQVVVADADGSSAGRAIGPRKESPPGDAVNVQVSKAFTPDATALIVRYGSDEDGEIRRVPIDGTPDSIIAAGAFEFVDVQRLAP